MMNKLGILIGALVGTVIGGGIGWYLSQKNILKLPMKQSKKLKRV